MVDATQNLPGTIASVNIPESTSAARISTSQTGGQPVQIGTDAPVSPAPSPAEVAVDVKSVVNEVVDSMKQMPPPIDIEAVSKIRDAIAANEYPIDVEKVSEELMRAFESLH